MVAHRQDLEAEGGARRQDYNRTQRNTSGGGGAVCALSLSSVQLFSTPWTVTHQAPLSLGFSRQEHWSGLPFPSPGDLPKPGMQPRSPALQADSLPLSHLGSIFSIVVCISEKAMAPHSSTLAWKIPWTEEPGRLQSMGSLELDTTERLHFHFSLFTFMHWRRKWQPTPVFLPGESQGWGSLVGCHLWGRTESDTTEATEQQQCVYVNDSSQFCKIHTTCIPVNMKQLNKISRGSRTLSESYFLPGKGQIDLQSVLCWKKEHLFPFISGFHHFASPVLAEINAMANRKDYSNNNYTMHFQS